ncbi:MAG: lysine--tRNA ligase [Candidatus Eisenbacteria bacterium]|nr:lysine--tRNA ligase [Candidatus Eisenbacteria bacterium]
MSQTTDPTAVRAEKLRAIRDLGIDPYPHTFRRTHSAREALEKFEQLEERETLLLAGRLRSIRPMGKAAFAHIEDAAAAIQIYLRRDVMGEEAYRLVPLLDLGDLIGVEGKLFRTRMGEISLRVERLVLLAKALKPMPVVKEKEGRIFDAFSDREMRYRRRDLDLMVNAEVRDLFRKRAAVIRALRSYLDERGFLEVETPVLQAIYGGAAARPFRTHHHALDMDLYLRIAEELPLKKLLVGGLERVYEIGRVFRNEGVDRHHNPEFTLLEFYWAYADYTDAMDLVEDMLRATAQAVTGGLAVARRIAETDVESGEQAGRRAGENAGDQAGEHAGDRAGEELIIDFSQPFARKTMLELIHAETGADVLGMPVEKLAALGERVGASLPQSARAGQWIEKIFDAAVAPKLVQPTFVIDHPKAVSPLAKSHRRDRENLVERFELFILGNEYANAFSELNDPEEQRRRFEDQRALREAGDLEAHPLDEEFLQALEQGMPPAAGVGIGVDRLVMLLTGAEAIKDVLLFPHMRSLEGTRDEASALDEESAPAGAGGDEGAG